MKKQSLFKTSLLATSLAAGVLLSTGCKSPVSKPDQSNQVIVNAIPAIAEVSPLPSSAEVMAQMEHVANWQVPRLDKLDYLSYRRSESERPKWWVQGAFQTGLIELAERSTNPFYENWVEMRGNELNWELGKRYTFGDDQLVGQTWLWHYKRNGGEHKIQPTKKAFDSILANKPTVGLEFDNQQNNDLIHKCQTRWCWADALFMAPPVWFSLSEATGDPRYFEYANAELKETINYLYDDELHLMYRDSRFIGKKGEFGEQIFWARGTGWVYAGLVRIMEYIPKDHPDRPFYDKLYLELSAKLKELQKRDGSWAMSLLAGEKIKEPEMSGTAFFVYGLAWGINEGLLTKEDYWPTISKGWNALNSSVHPSGKLGWVQGIGAAPGVVSYDDSQIYGVGGYLLAGSAIYDLAQKKEMAETKKQRTTYGRYVPERLDDFAWENDKVAFRIYGPDGNVSRPGSGVDAWFKRVPYPVINKWYDEHLTKNISYHKDQGEGYDIYHTGSTRGVGGTAVLVDGKPYSSHVFKNTKILSNDGETITFQVNFNDFETPIGFVNETKIISLSMGSQMYHAKSTFELNKKPAKLTVAVGLNTQDEKSKVYSNKGTGRISTWQMYDGKGVGTGALISPANGVKVLHTPSKEKDRSHVWLVTETTDNGEVEFKAGFAWEGAGDITTLKEWNNYLDTYK